MTAITLNPPVVYDLVDFDIGRFCAVDDASQTLKAGSHVTAVAFDVAEELAKVRWDDLGRCYVPGNCNYRIVGRWQVAA